MSKPSDYHPWVTFIYAREEARRRGDRRVGTEHLVLGLVSEPAMAEVLGRDLPTARAALDALDHDALVAVGLGEGLDAPPIPIRERTPRPTVRAVLKDRLPMTPAAMAAMKKASRDIRRGRRIPPERVMLALVELEPPDPAYDLFGALGIDRTELKQRLVVTSA